LPASPATVGTYLTSLAGRLAVATLERRLAALATAHRLAGHRLDTRHPTIHDLLRGIRRAHGTAQRRVAPATTAVVQAMAAACGTASCLGVGQIGDRLWRYSLCGGGAGGLDRAAGGSGR
jgi:hypothetical protein